MLQNLPAWAVPHPMSPGNAVLVDPDLMYPALLEALGFTERTKYTIQCCYQAMKLELQRATGTHGLVIHIRSDDGRKQRWNLSMFPGDHLDILAADKGGPAAAAYRGEPGSDTRDRARQHFSRARGVLPSGKLDAPSPQSPVQIGQGEIGRDL